MSAETVGTSADADRLIREIEAFGEIGRSAETGLLRALYTPAWSQAMDMVRARMQALGLRTWYDAAGNLYGRLEGAEKGPVVLTGSHIDTVPNAGIYDGTLGIVGSLAAVETLARTRGRPRRSIDVLVTCDEDGARFATEYWGSQAIAGTIVPDELNAIRDRDGISIGEAMRAAGFAPDRIAEARRDDVFAWVELHIEQGPVLKDEGTEIGIVTALAGRWSGSVRVSGREDHAGTTPMDSRHDALAGAMRMIAHAIGRAEAMGRPTVCTVGKVDVRPGGTNIVPSEVEFTIDARDTDGDQLGAFARDLQAFAHAVAAERGLGVAFENFVMRAPTPMDAALVAEAAVAAEACGATATVMPSMASHDARILGTRWPSIMLFVPSRDGRSHCPEEYTSPEQMRVGVEVLTALLGRLSHDLV